jgi:general secretion pathway protein N
MKRAVWISLLAILAFAAILLVRLPVQWVAGFIPQGVSCAQLAGTVWNGMCSGLVAQGAQVGTVVWQLHPAALLSGKVAAHVELTRDSHFVRADVEAESGGKITARNLTADLPLDPTLIPQLPRSLAGSVTTNLLLIRVDKSTITAVQGQFEAHDLVHSEGGKRYALGSYSLSFPAADAASEPVGQLKSLQGPLDVRGTMRLTREPGWVLEGLVAAGPDTPPQLAQQLAYLGAPDAQGKRQFSLEGTF